MDIGIKLLPVMWVFQDISTVHEIATVMAQAHRVYHYPSLFPVLFLYTIPIC